MYNIILYFPKTTLIFIIINLLLFCVVKVLWYNLESFISYSYLRN
jgi:hypothetical protein